MSKKSHASKILRRSFRVVALSAVTGLSPLLRGLKEYCVRRSDDHPTPERPISHLVAIVTLTVSDDGGYSGRLRRENGGCTTTFVECRCFEDLAPGS
jgi:2-phospho-L-lactate transferase/gluconeogenesis factor (CofD/UPF0052 family)